MLSPRHWQNFGTMLVPFNLMTQKGTVIGKNAPKVAISAIKCAGLKWLEKCRCRKCWGGGGEGNYPLTGKKYKGPQNFWKFYLKNPGESKKCAGDSFFCTGTFLTISGKHRHIFSQHCYFFDHFRWYCHILGCYLYIFGQHRHFSIFTGALPFYVLLEEKGPVSKFWRCCAFHPMSFIYSNCNLPLYLKNSANL